ncbi:inheritance GTPase [Schizosaccharomyces japonicus yFS275]|uniref:Inheritance GTPase n=1 Tax=Schizosaccharomyces japonicus (strain yFS275 / FY16936) TaxID=402676 RepID=B6K201_SCHJY|nr:inheritance GTPase [Schizosaccharomyces japonicus yFS275]EEB07182.1 inheritance GTPase [Schizosaccharomyces japonicus yFS275]
MHEILSFAFGGKSNFVSTHFWNAQEKYLDQGNDAQIDREVAFFERKTNNIGGDVVFHPRTLIYDDRDAFGTTIKNSKLLQPDIVENNNNIDIFGYAKNDNRKTGEGPEDVNTWSGKTVCVEAPPLPLHPYQAWLDQETDPAQANNGITNKADIDLNACTSWSDFHRLYYDPRSLQPLKLPTGFADCSTNSFITGQDAFQQKNADSDEHYVWDTAIRPLLEDCDMIQGFQLSLDVCSAWSGYASSYIRGIQDELEDERIPLWIFGIREQRTVMQETKQHFMNEALFMASTADAYSKYVPICVDTTAQSIWHTSAFASVALETFTLPTRLTREKRVQMSDIERVVSLTRSSKLFGMDAIVLGTKKASIIQRWDVSWGSGTALPNTLAPVYQCFRGTNMEEVNSLLAPKSMPSGPSLQLDKPAFPADVNTLPEELKKVHGVAVSTSGGPIGYDSDTEETFNSNSNSFLEKDHRGAIASVV